MDRPARRTSFPRHLYRAAWVVCFVSVATSALEFFGAFRSFENGFFDAFTKLKKPEAPANVRVVGITEEDFRNKDLFNGELPLNQKKVQNLIRNIVLGHPKAIAVDIDTEHWSSQAYDLPDEPGCPIIWARDSYRDAEGKLHWAFVLGGRKPPFAADTGIARIPRDNDGVIRRHRRMWDTQIDEQASVPLPSFVWAVVKAVDPERVKKTDEKEDLLLNFRGDFYNLVPMPASRIFDIMKKRPTEGEGFRGPKGPLKNMIILVGNFYHASRDEHVTPLGTMAGVQIMAQAIESELSGGGIRRARELWMLVLEVSIGFLLAIAQYYVPTTFVVPVSLVSMFVLTPLCSFAAFASSAMWLNFVPIMLAVLIHELYDRARTNHETEEELETQKAQKSAMEKELEALRTEAGQ